jgi:lysophospholipase L1-like esterase
MRQSASVVLAAGLLVIGVSCASKTPTGPSGTPTPFSMTCPTAPTAASPDGSPVTVTFSDPSVTGGTQPVTTTCTPASGSQFSVGTTNVTCQSTDAARRLANCSFSVSVQPPPRLQYTRLLAFGDSITQGGTSGAVPRVSSAPMLWDPAGVGTELLAAEPYPLGLERRLSARYPQQSIRVINSGVSGEIAFEGGVSRFRGAIMNGNPEVVLLMEGTNDMNFPSGADAAIGALKTMIDEAQAQGRRVCLASVPPQRPDGDRRRALPASRIPGFNDRVRALAESRQLVFVDVFNAMTMSMIGADDVHPTQQGYSVISDTFANTISANLAQSTAAMAGSRHR